MPTHTRKQISVMLTTLAYICTHPQDWRQGSWRCGSGMCFAGHAAITIGGLAPFVVDPEHDSYGMTESVYIPRWLEKAYHFNLNPMPVDHFLDDDEVKRAKEDPNVNVKRLPVDDVSDAAQELMGLDNTRLFSGSNGLNDIVELIGEELGLTVEEVRTRAHEIAKKEGWRWPRKALEAQLGITW